MEVYFPRKRSLKWSMVFLRLQKTSCFILISVLSSIIGYVLLLSSPQIKTFCKLKYRKRKSPVHPLVWLCAFRPLIK